jgi:D-sedoheptulose 7-phosphate isomerase
MLESILLEISESIEVKKRVLETVEIHEKLRDLAQASLDCLQANGKLIFCGNGGSFADSQHIAAELVSRLRFDREPLPALALGTNSSNLTAIGNDYGYENIFSRELKAIAHKQDVFVPISTSGNSANVLNAIKIAREMGLRTYGFTGGTGGKMVSACDCLIAPATITDKIQEVHIMFGHILCHLIESGLFRNK